MILLSWSQFHQDCEILADKIRQSGRVYDKMLCITRGGVFVGALVAHYLDFRNITTVALKLYEFDNQLPVVEQLSGPDLPLPGTRVLLVDDLLDSGRTIAFIREKWGEDYHLDTAVLYDKGGGDYRPDFAASRIPDEWVQFPWEMPIPGADDADPKQ